MILEFPIRRDRPGSTRSRFAATVLKGLVGGLLLLLPLLSLSLSTACSHRHDPTATAPPAITVQPVATSTVSGRATTLTVTATGQSPLYFQWAKDGVNILGATTSSYILYNPRTTDAGNYTVTITNTLGTITSTPAYLTVAQTLLFTTPMGLAADAAGNLFVSDRDDHVIWKISTTHQKTLLAGAQGLAGSSDGQGSAARFNSPGGLALDPAGNLVVADTGNHTLRRVAMDGTVSTLAGSAGVPGTTDALGPLARFNAPFGLVITSAGITYISDSLNHTIRRMGTDGSVSTLAGQPGVSGLVDGTGSAALLNQPNGLALAANGLLYFTDYGNSDIRTVSTTGIVTTVAGHNNTATTTTGYADGNALSSLFSLPVGIAVDGAGVVWIADTHNHVLRRLMGGVTSTQAGVGGTVGNVDGTGTAAYFNQPTSVVFTPAGTLVIADSGNHMLRTYGTDGTVGTITTP